MEERNLTGLIERSKNGDLQAIEELLKESYASVSYKCRRMLGNEQDAEDLTQEILLIIYTKLNTLSDPEAYWGWLNRIATNRCYNFLERNHKDLQFAEDKDGNSVIDTIEVLDERQVPDKAMDNAETARMIDEIVEGLPEAQRAAILMYYYDEMSVREIAKTMNIPEGTVKRRLDLARNKIEARVKDYEKQGIKLYSVSVLPFLWYYLRLAAQREANTYAAKAAAASIVAGGSAAGAASASGAATAAASAGTGTVGSATANVLSSISGKMIAGIAAAAILVGGGAVAIGSLGNNNEDHHPTETLAIAETVPTVVATAETEVSETQETVTTDPSTEPVETDLSADAYIAYEELMKRGITNQGLQIAYFTYLDLNQDDIPELLVSDGPGTADTMSQGELYAWDGTKLVSCGLAGAYYDSFYLANGRYVRGLSRMGNQFLSPTESIYTTIYYWDESMSRNDPAISYNNKDWEYISAEEFDYYNAMPDGNTSDCFVQTAEPIALSANSLMSDGTNIVTSHFVIHLPQDWEGKYVYDMTEDAPGGIRVKIYERTNHEAGKALGIDGLLATIMLFESESDYKDIPSCEYMGCCYVDETKYDIVLMTPTDARFIWEPGDEDTTYMDAYHELCNDLYEDWYNEDPQTDHLRISISN